MLRTLQQYGQLPANPAREIRERPDFYTPFILHVADACEYVKCRILVWYMVSAHFCIFTARTPTLYFVKSHVPMRQGLSITCRRRTFSDLPHNDLSLPKRNARIQGHMIERSGGRLLHDWAVQQKSCCGIAAQVEYQNSRHTSRPFPFSWHFRGKSL